MSLFAITGCIWVLCVASFTSAGGAIHWGSEWHDCLHALFYFALVYGTYFIGLRFYISKVITILCTVMAAWIVIIMAGSVHWLLCIPAGIAAIAAAIGLSVLVWKTNLE